MILSEFMTETGFHEDFARTVEPYWQDSPESETMPDAFSPEFLRDCFPLIHAPEGAFEPVPAVIDACRKYRSLRVYANLLHRLAFVEKNPPQLHKFPECVRLLGENAGVLSLLVALGSVPLIAKTHARLGLPPEYAAAAADWIGGTVRIYAAGHQGRPGHDLRQLHWVRLAVDGKLFRIGRFEYLTHTPPEWLPAIYRNGRSGRSVALAPDGWFALPDGTRCEKDAPGAIAMRLEEEPGRVTGVLIDPATGKLELDAPVTLALNEFRPVLAPHDWVPSVHIPGGGGMTGELAADSLRRAKVFFQRYFKKEVPAFVCESWILNPDWLTEMPESNIAGFMRELYLFGRPPSPRAGLFFVFGRDDGDLAEYPADNSLRRAFHRVWAAGRELRSGGMFFLTADLDRFGTGFYRRTGGRGAL